MPIRRIGVLSAGGDCPGINAVIHAVVKAILDYQMEVYGIFDGFAGLVEGRWKTLQYNDVSGIMPLGERFWEPLIKLILLSIPVLNMENFVSKTFLKKQ